MDQLIEHYNLCMIIGIVGKMGDPSNICLSLIEDTASFCYIFMFNCPPFFTHLLPREEMIQSAVLMIDHQHHKSDNNNCFFWLFPHSQ